jgi:signal transduction histidine kinase
LDVVELPSETQLELVAKDGSTRWVSFLAGAVGSGKDRSWVVLVRDVSSDHEAEQAKSDFLTTVSHELRTPLTTIKGSLEILARGVDKLPADTADQMIDVTRRGADRLERLVMNLLTVSQIETGAMHIYADEVALDRIVRDSATAILDGREQVRIVVPKEDVVVRADHEHLTQAIDHLLDNARKFGAPEGWITIEVRCERGFGYISVFDEGPGVPVADRERIFERFVRLGNILTREQGPGIGLFVAKCGVDAMGGSIWADGEPGAGAAFHIELPLARPMAVDATA